MRKHRTLLGLSVHRGLETQAHHEEFSTTTRQIIAELAQNGMVIRSAVLGAKRIHYCNDFAPVKKLTGMDSAPTRRILGIIRPTAGLYNPETALLAGMLCPRLPKGRLVNAAMEPLQNGIGDQYLFSFLRIETGCLVYANLANPDRDFDGKELFLYPAPSGTRLIR